MKPSQLFSMAQINQWSVPGL